MQTIPLHTVQIVFYIIAFILLALASLEDIKTMQIPNWITNSFVASCGLYFTLLVTAQPFKMPLSNLTGALIVTLPMFIYACLREGSIGGADIRLVFGLGLLVGTSDILRVFVFSAVYAVTTSIIRTLIRHQKFTFTCNIPYVPFLLLALSVNIFL